VNPYRLERVRRAFVLVIGPTWEGRRAATSYELSDADLATLATFTRADVRPLVARLAGDFAHVSDFAATCGEEQIEWEKEGSEEFYNACVYGPEDGPEGWEDEDESAPPDGPGDVPDAP
jgi:hypothetical protein